MDSGLTIDQIVDLMILSKNNAKELMNDAEFLLADSRHSRSFTLLFCSCEELSKFFIIEAAGRRVSQNNPPNWKRFWQRMRNHDSKIAHIKARVDFVLMREKDEKTRELARAGFEIIWSIGLRPRNASLYVDAGPESEFRKPSDINWEIGIEGLHALATCLLSAADELGSSPQDILHEIKRDPGPKEIEVALSAIASMAEEAKKIGISRDDISKKIQVMFSK